MPLPAHVEDDGAAQQLVGHDEEGGRRVMGSLRDVVQVILLHFVKTLLFDIQSTRWKFYHNFHSTNNKNFWLRVTTLPNLAVCQSVNPSVTINIFN